MLAQYPNKNYSGTCLKSEDQCLLVKQKRNMDFMLLQYLQNFSIQLIPHNDRPLLIQPLSV